MNSLKLFIINALTLIVGLGLMSGTFSSQDASASDSQNVPKIQVQRLTPFKGQYLTAVYGIGQRPFLSKDSAATTLSEIKTAKTVYIAGDYVDFANMELSKEGSRLGYNLVVFVISREPGFDWKSVAARKNAITVRAYTKSELDALMTGQGLADGVILTL